MFKVIDYTTGKQVLPTLFEDKQTAWEAKQKYLLEKFKEKVIHNNLLLVVEV